MEAIYKFILVFSLIMIIFFFIFLFNKKRKQKGRKAEKTVSFELKKICKRNKFKYMNNVYLPLYDDTCEIDHLVFAKSGIFVIETKGISGVVSGSGKQLTHKIGTKTHKLYNPKLQNQTHIDNVIHHLKIAGYKNVPVIGVVVFTSNDLRDEANVGIKLYELDNFILRHKKSGCDIKKLYRYFKTIKIDNPFKKLKHDIKAGLK